jgi:flagellin
MPTVNSNSAAMFALNKMRLTERDMTQSMEQLSSGKRINHAGDDAAGAAIADRMTAQIKGLEQSVRNAADVISMTQVTEGALDESSSIIQRIRELAIQSASDVMNAEERSYLDQEVIQLLAELDRVTRDTTFNEIAVLDGSFADRRFQIGTHEREFASLSISSMRLDSLGAYKTKSDTTDTSGVNANLALNAYATGSATDTNLVQEESFTIHGILGTASVEVEAGSNVRDIVTAVNATFDTTGVSAVGSTQLKLEAKTLDDAYNGQTSISFSVQGKNATAVTIAANITLSHNASDTVMSELRDSINNYTTTTGVTATLSSDKSSIILVQNEGYDIKLGDVNFAEDSATSGAKRTLLVTSLDNDEVAAGNAVSLGDTNATATDVDGIWSGTISTTSTVIGATPTETSISVSGSTTLGGASSTFDGSGSSMGTGSITTMSLADASSFPTSGGTIKIGSEYFTYTGVTGNDLTGVTRAAESSTAADHADTAAVSLVIGSGDTLSGAGTITVASTADFTSSGTIKIGSEFFTYTGTTATTFTGVTRATSSTTAAQYDQSVAIVQALSDSATTINVASTTGFPTAGTLQIGSEYITYTGTTDTSFTGVTRGVTVDTITSTASAHSNSDAIKDMTSRFTSTGPRSMANDDDIVSVSQAISSGFTGTESLTMVDTTATLNSFITISSTAASGASFVITGTDIYGNAQSETITGHSSGTYPETKTSTNIYGTVTSIKPSTTDSDALISVGVKNTITDKSGLVTITSSASNESGVTFTVVGTGMDGSSLTEVITGPEASSTVSGRQIFKSIHTITPSSTTTGAIQIGIKGADSVVVTGQLELSSSNSFTVLGEDGKGLFEASPGAATLDKLSGVNLRSRNSSIDALRVLDRSLDRIHKERAKLGALMSRMEKAIDNLSNVALNTNASRGRIEDADFAKASARLTKAQILQQSAMAMIAQAGKAQQNVLQLLQN